MQLDVLLNHINRKIMKHLFRRDPEKLRQYEKFMAMDLSNDSLDDENIVCDDELNSKREPQPWLVETLVGILEKETGLEHGSDQTLNTLIGSLKNELLDLLESEYFQSTLFEVLQSSFKFCINKSAIEQIYHSEDEESSSEALDPGDNLNHSLKSVKL